MAGKDAGKDAEMEDERSALGPFVARGKVRYGQKVILYAGHTNIRGVQVEAGGEFRHRFGVYDLDKFAGATFGSAVEPREVYSNRRKRNKRRREQESLQVGGFGNLFPVTPELWAEAVEHRTQITFPLTNNVVCANLHLAPGNVVVESGTGSGSLTCFLARAVGPIGHVHTFEFNEGRYEAARKDFKELGLDHMVTVKHQDVYSDGFGAGLDGKADACFLDLPNPWKAIPHARRALKPFGRICNFSPCIEQVQRACECMSRLGFSHLQTVEVVLQEQRVWHSKSFRAPCFKKFNAAAPEANAGPDDAKNNNDDDDDEGDGDDGDHKDKEEDEAADPVQINANGGPRYKRMRSQFPMQGKMEPVMQRVVTNYDKIAGHTGYLTFAYAPPLEE